MTPAKQKIAMAAIELFKRNLSGDEQKKSIRCSEDIFNLMQSIVGDIENEEVWVLLLNSKLKMIKRIRVASGGIDRAIVDVRIILKEAIMNNAVALALTLTINLPSSPVNNQIVTLNSVLGVTTLTLATFLGTIVGGVTSLVAGVSVRYIWIASQSKWYKI